MGRGPARPRAAGPGDRGVRVSASRPGGAVASRCLRAAAVLLLALAAAARPPAAAAGEGDLVLEATLDAESVRLGDDVTIQLALTNRSASFVAVPTFRLARDAVSVRVSRGGEVRSTVTRVYGSWTEEEGGLRLHPEATPQRRLAPGTTYRGSVTFAAVAAGDLVLTALLGPEGEGRLSSKPLALEVTPKSGPPKRLVAHVDTSLGVFVVELDGAASFNAVSHFWGLARSGWHDHLLCHRVLRGLLVQGGDPRGDGSGGPGFTLPAEGDGRPLVRGAFGLARGAHADTAGSQWFAVSDPEGRAASALRAEWTPLGRVVEGQDVVDALTEIETDPRTHRPKTPPRVVAIRASVR